MKEKKDLTFEQAFEKLEAILQKMNEGKVSLEESLQLFEEGNSLLEHCQGKLNQAEQKIELLLKNREGKLQVDEKGSLESTPFEALSKEQTSYTLHE